MIRILGILISVINFLFLVSVFTHETSNQIVHPNAHVILTLFFISTFIASISLALIPKKIRQISGYMTVTFAVLGIALLINDYVINEHQGFHIMFMFVTFLCVFALGGCLLIIGKREKEPSGPYAGFWPRFGAVLLDGAILVPISVLLGNLAYQNSKLFVAIFLFFDLVAVNFLLIYLLAKFGGTPGKLLMGLRVKKLSFEKIGWKEAWLRFSVDLVILGAILLFRILILLNIEFREFTGLSYSQKVDLYHEKSHFWLPFIYTIQTLWISSEGVVLLLNKRKRAIHDFIAGTVVVKSKML